MDISELTSQLAGLPGQVPDEDERESRFTRFFRSSVFDNPQMVKLYREQGLPVDEVQTDETYILSPEDGDAGEAGEGGAVLYEAGLVGAPGSLVTAVWGDRVQVDLCAPADFEPDQTLLLELVRLRPAGVLSLRYLLPAPSGRVLFLAAPDLFGVRTTLFLQKDGLCRPLVFGPRVSISRAK